METQKIANLLNYTDNEFTKFTSKNCMSLIIKVIQNIVKEIKMIQALNLRQKILNQVFMIIQMHIFL